MGRLNSVRFKFPFYVLLPVVVVIAFTAVGLFKILGQRNLETRARGMQRQVKTIASNIKLILQGVERVARLAALELTTDHDAVRSYAELEAILKSNPDLHGIALVYSQSKDPLYVVRAGDQLVRQAQLSALPVKTEHGCIKGGKLNLGPLPLRFIPPDHLGLRGSACRAGHRQRQQARRDDRGQACRRRGRTCQSGN